MLKQFSLFLVLMIVTPNVALAQDFEEFSEESFEKALDSGNPIVVNFYESWCSRCTTQRRNLRALLEEDDYENVIVLEAVFSEHRDFAKDLGILARTSLALIKDRELVAIEVGGTTKDAVEALLMAEPSENS